MRGLRDDRGVTLVELVLTVAVLTVVMPALALAVMTVWNASSAASRSAAATAERSLLSTHFTADVAEASAVVVGGAACTVPAAGTPSLVVASFSVPGGSVSYAVAGTRPEYDGSTSSLLLRLDCSTAPSRETVVASVVEGAVPSLVCVPADTCRTVRLSVPQFGGAVELSAARRVS